MGQCGGYLVNILIYFGGIAGVLRRQFRDSLKAILGYCGGNLGTI